MNLFPWSNSNTKKSNTIELQNNYTLPIKNILKVVNFPKEFNKNKTYKWPSDKRVIFEQFGYPDNVMENLWEYKNVNGVIPLTVEFEDSCDDLKAWTLFFGCYSRTTFSNHSVSHNPKGSNQLERFMLPK